ncbi:MAG: hypothetical protein ACYC65_01190 [Candidatus Limnocylindrales bacterium]
MGSALIEILARAWRAARGAARAFEQRLQRLSDFLRDILLPEHSSARPYLLMAVFAAVILGTGGARLLVQGDPAATAAPTSAAAATQGAGGDPTPEPAASDTSTPEPTPRPTLQPTPWFTPEPTPAGLALRGPIDTAPMADTGLVIGSHEARLTIDPDGGPVAGTFTIGIRRFPIGALLTRTFDGEDDPGFDVFRTCSVTLVLVGVATGTHDAATGRVAGTAAFKATTDDVDDCLKTRPANVTIDPDEIAQPTTRTWRATFDGTTAAGIIDLDPVLSFTATAED